jgi:hypothetical protein
MGSRYSSDTGIGFDFIFVLGRIGLHRIQEVNVTRLFAIVIYLMLAILYSGSVFAAQAPGYNESAIANFYRGKTVTIVVGHSAGGGFDR